MSRIKTLNLDVLGEVFDRFNLLEQAILAQTCKKFYKIYAKNTSQSKREFYDTTLYRRQYSMARSFKKSKGITAVRAMKGFGKTIMGLAACTPYSIILVPSAVLKTWKKETKNIGMFHPDPEKSDILVYSPAMKNYMKYFKKTDLERDTSIILASDIHAKQVYDFLMSYKPQHVEWSLIVDEAHKPNRKEVLSMIGRGPTRTLLLSGSQIAGSIIGVRIDRSYWTDPEATIRASPKAKWHLERLQRYETRYIKAELENITNQYEKTVFCITNVEAENLGLLTKINVVGKKKPVLADWNDAKVFRVLSSTEVIDKFDAYEGTAILLINTMSNESLNINADCLVVVSPFASNIERGIQTSARIIRPTNNRKKVDIYMFCYNDFEVQRAFYTQVFAYNYWKWDTINQPEPAFLRKVMAIMRMVDFSMTRYDPAKACIIMADYDRNDIPTEDLIVWWKEHRGKYAILTEQIVRDLAAF